MCWSCSHTKKIGLQNTKCRILLPGNIYFSKNSLNTQTELFSEAQSIELVVSPWLWYCWHGDCLSSNIVRSLLSSLFLPAFIWWSFFEDSFPEEIFFSFLRIYILVQLMYSSFTLIRAFFLRVGTEITPRALGLVSPSHFALQGSSGPLQTLELLSCLFLCIEVKFSSLLQSQWGFMSYLLLTGSHKESFLCKGCIYIAHLFSLQPHT